MKNVFFILLVFISFQGFSQNMKINICYNLEVMETDLGELNWYAATEACEKLGDGWRLPTSEELQYIYANRDVIGGFLKGIYWSSSSGENGGSGIYFGLDYNEVKSFSTYARAVRTIK